MAAISGQQLFRGDSLSKEADKCFPILSFVGRNQRPITDLMPRQCETGEPEVLCGWPPTVVFAVLKRDVCACDPDFGEPSKVILDLVSALFAVRPSFLHF